MYVRELENLDNYVEFGKCSIDGNASYGHIWNMLLDIFIPQLTRRWSK